MDGWKRDTEHNDLNLLSYMMGEMAGKMGRAVIQGKFKLCIRQPGKNSNKNNLCAYMLLRDSGI